MNSAAVPTPKKKSVHLSNSDIALAFPGASFYRRHLVIYLPIYLKQARLWSLLLHIYTRKCEMAKTLNLTFSPVWITILSEQKIWECAKINQLHRVAFIECNGNNLIQCDENNQSAGSTRRQPCLGSLWGISGVRKAKKIKL